MDRIDICAEAAPVTYSEVAGSEKNESSAAIRARVETARRRQRERFCGLGILCNGEMRGSHVRSFCRLGYTESHFMREVFDELQLSARMYDRVLKVARTAADLEGKEEIGIRHLSEAVSYVRVREKYWGGVL